MKLARFALTSALIAAIGSAVAIELKTDAQKIGYTLGSDVARSVLDMTATDEENSAELIDINAVIIGFKETYDNKGKNLALSDSEMEEVMEKFAKERLAALQKKISDEAMQKLNEGKAFLDENKQKEGVKVTDSGLQYVVVKEGTGASPKASDEVTVHYEGRLIDGKVFDSSLEREPVTFPLNYVIAGWTEGLQLMQEGAKYTFYIPSELGYGETGAGRDIPPNAVLVFDVELISVNKQADTPAETDKSDEAVEAAKAEAAKTEEVIAQVAKEEVEAEKSAETSTEKEEEKKSNPIGNVVNQAIEDVVNGSNHKSQ